MNPTAPVVSPSGNLDSVTKLKEIVIQASLPQDLTERLNEQLDRLTRAISSQGYKIEFDREFEYIKFIATLPFNKSSNDILDLARAAQVLDKHHYGLKTAKDRILEYLSVLILNSRQGKSFHSSVLAFVGLVGSGKTSLAYSIAEALGRKIIRIPFGGLGSVKELRGESRIRAEAEPGRLLKTIQSVGVNNPVVLLDELDRVAVESRADVMGVLVELLDPEQNASFIDHYVDYPFDLSKALFIATANNTANIATAVMDRLEVIEMPAYADEEKIAIARDYVLPKAIKEAGIAEGTLSIDGAIWPQIVRPLGYDAGIRSLQRTIQTVVRKVAKNVVEGNPGPYVLTAENFEKYIG